MLDMILLKPIDLATHFKNTDVREMSQKQYEGVINNVQIAYDPMGKRFCQQINYKTKIEAKLEDK